MRLSASQVQTYVDCPRKWAWRYVEGVEDTPSPAAELGKSVHAELEKYLSGGEIDFTTEAGYIAAAGLEHLPKPGAPGLLIEQEFHFEGPLGHSYLGYKDLEQPGAVIDHKTTSDLKWQKTSEDLKKDIQATLYAVDYFRKYPEEIDVELRWVYYQTRNTRKSAVTRLRVYQPEIWQRFLEIEQIAEQMELASTKRALELPPNTNHCSAYGGCPHQGRCNLSPFDKMRSYMEQNKLLAALQAKKNGAPPGDPHTEVMLSQVAAAHTPPQPATAPAPAPAPPAPMQAPAGTVTNKLLARLQAGGAPFLDPRKQTPAATMAGGAPVAVRSTVEPAAINPPEYQPPPAAAPVAPTREQVVAAIASGQTLSGPIAQAAQLLITEAARSTPTAAPPQSLGGLLPAVAPVLPAPPVAPAPLATAAESRGRGRPKKAAVPPTGLPVKIDTLYLDCGPVGVAVVDATQLVVLAKQRIAAEGLADYRFAEFGHGPGMLAVAVAAQLDALEGVIPAVRLDTTTPEGAIVAVELTARAALVVR